MALSTITLDGQSVTLVDVPTTPGLRSVQWNIDDPAGISGSGFSNQTQVQVWPGADLITGQCELPPLALANADAWISFLMACRGMANGFMLGDPLKTSPRANLQGSVPLVDGSNVANNLAGTTLLYTKGWKPNAARVFLERDPLQIGSRLYFNLFPVTADGNGNAILNIYPSFREQPADGTPLIVHNAKGMFRLSNTKRTFGADYTRLSKVSLQIMEYRGATYGS